MTTKIQKWGNSLAVRLPRAITKKYGLREGGDVMVREERDRITIMRILPQPLRIQKNAWRKFLIPTKNKKENISGRIDDILYGIPR